MTAKVVRRHMTTTARRQFVDPYARWVPKVIEAALDLMPTGPPWDQAEYEEWLAYFDQACRLYYRIRRSGLVG